MTIKILETTPGCMPEILKVGDCIDLITAEDYTFKSPRTKVPQINEGSQDIIFSYSLINLGVIIELPKGFEGILIPRSSTFKKWGLIQTNSVGLIDQSYCGPTDIWKFPVLATRNVTIPKGTPIAQFKIQLSQKATIWQKLRWLFSHKITLKKISKVNNEDRGGFGTGSDKYRNNNK